MKAIKLLPKYLWQYKFVILLFFVFTAVFALMAYLYQMAVEAVLYAFLLCFVITILTTAVHFYVYCKKHFERIRLFNYPFTLKLPAPQNLTETELFAVIEKIRERYKNDLGEKQKERAEYSDYYTMWMHQIKTPISAMGLILQNSDTKESRALTAELFRIEQYVEMALWYLRMDDMTDMVFKSYDLDEIIKEAVRKYAPLFISKKIKVNYSPANCKVITDKKWLSFIIEQLLANAIKYTEKGSVTITVENKVIIIEDTGIGIRKEDLPRIFEKGYTGYNGRIEKKSTGIGLYLSRRAADKLSHKLSVTSEIGTGSKFYIDTNTYNLKVE